MGIFDVLKFWRKREAKAEGFPTGMAEFGAGEPGMPPTPGMPKLSGFEPPRLAEKMPSEEAGGGIAGMPPAPEFHPFPTPEAGMAGMPGAPAGAGAMMEKDIALISAKLDTLRAKLDSIEQRIEKIERIAEESR